MGIVNMSTLLPFRRRSECAAPSIASRAAGTSQRSRWLMLALGALALLLAGLASHPLHAQTLVAQADNNPSPAAGGSASQRANAAADKAMYKPVTYANARKKGPSLVVIPGEVKSNNATFTQRYAPNNIADYAELELSKANFGVLERTNLGPLLREFELAYNLGDPSSASKMLQKGKLKATRWVVKFDILKAEPVASAQQGFDGQTVGRLIGIFGGYTRGSAAAETAAGSVKSGETAGVWIVGMRYKVLDANTTEQVATGYFEDKMEVGATSGSFLGVSTSQQGGVTLDTLVQRLVQQSVSEIDANYK